MTPTRYTGRLWHHPRYGAVVRTGPPPTRSPWNDPAWRDLGDLDVLLDEEGWPRAVEGQPLPEGFLAGDARRQRFGMGGARIVYGPIEGDCRTCGQRYTFAAAEQRHWHEVLGFHTEARATQCARCRGDRLQRNRAHQALERAVVEWKASPSPRSRLEVARAALALATAGGRVELDRAVGHARAASEAEVAGADEVLAALIARRAQG